MLYKVRRRFYSQNFLRNPKLVAKLVGFSSIEKKDTVLEIGPGEGIITSELIKSARKVVAVELDYKLFLHLQKRFRSINNLELVRGNFLTYRLPHWPYKVFANVPFNITSSVVRKLTENKNFQEGNLVMQKEAAKKFIGMPVGGRNSLVAILLKPYFDFDIIWKFERGDFIPSPHVDVVMIKIKRRENPLVDPDLKDLYRDYIVYNYPRLRIGELSFEKVNELFRHFVVNASSREKKAVLVQARKFLDNQRNYYRKC